MNSSPASRTLAALAGLALAFIAGCDSGGVGSVSSSPVDRVSGAPLIPNEHLVVGPANPAVGEYTLELPDGAQSVTVRAGDLNGRLFRAQTPSGSAVVPHAHVQDHAVTVGLTGGGNGRLTVDLDSGLDWRLKIAGGASAASVDMSAGHLAGLEVSKGIGSLALTAGATDKQVTVSETAGLGSLVMHLPASTPITVQLRAGGGTVTLYGKAHQGLAAGTSLTAGGTGPGYLVDAQAGIGSMTVDTTG